MLAGRPRPPVPGVAVPRIRALFATTVLPARSEPHLIRGVLTCVGVFTFLFGVLGMPFLAPTRVESIILLLLLAAVALLCATLGQAVVIAAHLESRAEPVPEPERAG